jgi:filamentous hemagglutinin
MPTGDPAAINRHGQRIVGDILRDPGATFIRRRTKRFGDVIEVRAADGRGIRYDPAGSFIGFLEP